MPIPHKVIPGRIVIFAKDVMNITGKKERAARDLLQRIKEDNGKGAKQFVTIGEFCKFTGLPEAEVKSFLLQKRTIITSFSRSTLESSTENIGKGKTFDNIGGCLITFACRESFKRGHGGCVLLTPKTSLIRYYKNKYGFIYGAASVLYFGNVK